MIVSLLTHSVLTGKIERQSGGGGGGVTQIHPFPSGLLSSPQAQPWISPFFQAPPLLSLILLISCISLLISTLWAHKKKRKGQLGVGVTTKWPLPKPFRFLDLPQPELPAPLSAPQIPPPRPRNFSCAPAALTHCCFPNTFKSRHMLSCAHTPPTLLFQDREPHCSPGPWSGGGPGCLPLVHSQGRSGWCLSVT